MKYPFWVVIGILCGAALGIILSVGTFFVLFWLEGDRVNEAGTVFAILMILTVPGGALFGGYAGLHHARTGGWKGILSASTGASSDMGSSIALQRRFVEFTNQLSFLPREQALSAKQDYLRNLADEYESIQFNYPLFGICLLITLGMPLFLVVPVFMAVRHYKLKNALQDHLRETVSQWSDELNPRE